MILRLSAVVLLLAGCPKKPVPIDPATGQTEPVRPLDPVDTSRPYQDRVNEAADLIEKGGAWELNQAIALLESAVDEDPSGSAQFNLGLALLERGDLDRARQQLESVIASHPDVGDAWLALGHLQERGGDVSGALATYQSGVGHDPEHLELRVALIGALRRNGQPEEAIAAAMEALKVNTKSLGVYNNFGLAYLDQGNLVRAKFIFQKAIQEIDGAEQDPMLQTNLGWTYYLDDNKPAAAEHLQKALAIDPNLVPALVYLARVYMDDHNYGDTVPLLETAAKLDPNNADIQLTLGVAYRGVGRLDDAEKAYDRALQLDPSDPAPHFNTGVLRGDYRKDYAGAVNAFQTYVAANGPESELAQTYIKDITKEQELAEKRAKAEAERKARDEERKRKEALANQPAPTSSNGGTDGSPDGAPPDGPAPDAPAPEAPPEPAPAPAPE